MVVVHGLRTSKCEIVVHILYTIFMVQLVMAIVTFATVALTKHKLAVT